MQKNKKQKKSGSARQLPRIVKLAHVFGKIAPKFQSPLLNLPLLDAMGPGRLHCAKCMGCNELQVTLQRNCFGCRQANRMPWSCRPGMWKRGATRVNTNFWFCRAMLPKRMTWLVLDVLLLSRGWRTDSNLIRPSEREAKTTWSNK